MQFQMYFYGIFIKQYENIFRGIFQINASITSIDFPFTEKLESNIVTCISIHIVET